MFIAISWWYVCNTPLFLMGDFCVTYFRERKSNYLCFHVCMLSFRKWKYPPFTSAAIPKIKIPALMKYILMLLRYQGIKQELNQKVTFIVNIVHILSFILCLLKCRGFAVLHRLSLKLKPIFDIGLELLNHPMSHTARGCHSMSHGDSSGRPMLNINKYPCLHPI